MDNNMTDNNSTPWDNVLSDIFDKIGPAEGSGEAVEVPPEEQITEPSPQGNCIYCVECKNITLHYPQFPENMFHNAIIGWMRVVVIPRMNYNKRCFVCVLQYILQSQSNEFTLIDKIIAEKMMQSLPELATLPQYCIHTNVAPNPEEQVKESNEPSSTRPKNIRQILNEFRERSAE